MTDPTPQTNPTRDEAVRELLQSNLIAPGLYAASSVFARGRAAMAAEALTMLASAPAPASGDEVSQASREMRDCILGIKVALPCQIAEWRRLLTAPASGRVDAMGRSTGCFDKDGNELFVGDHVRYLLEGSHTKREYWNPEYEVIFDPPCYSLKHIGGGEDSGSHQFKLRSKGSMQLLRRASLSPAAMLVSEAGGGPTYTVNCCNCGRIIDTREEDEGGDGFGAELSDDRWTCSPECWDAVVEPDALAKPASSPAGWIVANANGDRFRCWSGGMSDWTDDREKATRYLRRVDAEDVHREDEDAWKVLPFGASSPAGGDVREALKAIAEGYAVSVCDDRYIIVDNPAYRPDNGSSPKLVIDTSAGRVGE